MNYKLIFSLILTAILIVGCSGSNPVQPQYYPEVGPLRPDHLYMEGADYYCARHIPGKTDQCFTCHLVN